jgi:renalase
MVSNAKPFPCIIIGAGLSGLVAARRLQDAGIQPVIVESASSAGGRMASWRLADSVGNCTETVTYDYGSQFFTVREPKFAELVSGWSERGIVREWSRGFATGDGSYYADGHPRYRGHPTMAAIPEYLAEGLPVFLEHRVVTVSKINSEWAVVTDKGSKLSARSLIMTPPVPISLSLLSAGFFQLPDNVQQSLEKIDYDPCLALMVLTEGPGDFPEPGGLWPLGAPIDWLADNYLKGVSACPGSFTIHAGPEFSQSHWNSDDETICRLLLATAEPWIGSPMKNYRIHRWQYSKPRWIYPDPCLGIKTSTPIVFAGDAFAGPRIEGAALSGLAAAEWLLGTGDRGPVIGDL